MASLLRHHDLENVFATQVDAAEVDGQERIPIFRSRFSKGTKDSAARAGDQNIDTSKMSMSFRDKQFDLRFLSYVSRNDKSDSAASYDIVRHDIEVLPCAGGKRDANPGASQG